MTCPWVMALSVENILLYDLVHACLFDYYLYHSHPPVTPVSLLCLKYDMFALALGLLHLLRSLPTTLFPLVDGLFAHLLI